MIHISLAAIARQHTNVSRPSLIIEEALADPESAETRLKTLHEPQQYFRTSMQTIRGGILLDADSLPLSDEELDSLLRMVRRYWHPYGFAWARVLDLASLAQAAYHTSQPVLHWHRVSPLYADWQILGAPQLQSRERAIIRHLIERGGATAEQIASDARIVPQTPDFSDPSVIEQCMHGTLPSYGASERDRSDIRHTLHRLAERHIVHEPVPGRYRVIRPT